MTGRLRMLLRDERGANLVEFAIALPIVVLMIYGIFTFGLLFQASAGMQHALGEAARHATIFPTPTDDAIRARVAREFGTGTGTLEPLQIDNANATGPGPNYKVLSLTYRQPMNFLFFQGPEVTLTREKRVYLST